MGSKQAEPTSGAPGNRFWVFLLLVFIVLSLFFRFNYLPGYTLASNDGPLGTLMSASHQLPEEFSGGWQDLNSIGIREGTWPSITYGLLCLLGPVLYSKLYVPVALTILGVGAWCFFRQLRFGQLACICGGLAAMLNSGFFSAACWGVAAHANTIGMSFFALAALADTAARPRWPRIILAGLAVGMGVAEGVDIGAIFSVYVAIFAVYQAWIAEGSRVKNLAFGVGRVAIVALFAGLLAAQAISGLVATAVKGVAGTKQDEQTKAARWEFSTQWSLPKLEALNVVIPGLFGYRMDTPQDMAGFQSWFRGGVYWGRAGRDAAWDRWFEGGRQGPTPGGFLRFTGGGNYAGVLVVLGAVWAMLQALRKDKSVFPRPQRQWIWFWTAIALGSLLLAFGRYAPFYRLFYALPYVSTIRNPAKFMHVVNWALVILFAYGVQGLSRRYLEVASAATLPLARHFKTWWSKLTGFERKWMVGCMVAMGASLLGWLIYASSGRSLQAYLGNVGFEPEMAKEIASASFTAVGWFLLFFALALVLFNLILSGWFAGRRAKLAGILLIGLLVADLGRANQPWIIAWNYHQKYASNPILDFLRNKSHEHRVASLPQWLLKVFRVDPQIAGSEQYFLRLYSVEWAQHTFLYHNIQSLDVVQMSRVPEELAAFEQAFQPRATTDFYLVPRRWQLTNTRYLLGSAGLLDLLNTYFDPKERRFKIVQQFEIVNKPDVAQPTKLQELTAVPSTNGPFAVFEFTGALPRAKLYHNWLSVSNAPAALQRLTSAEFDPAQMVVLTEPLAVPSSTGQTNQNSGPVEYTYYDPNRIVLRAKAEAPAILLVSDRYDPNWKVTVDGKPATLLQANYIMRGVHLAPGEHTVEMRFAPPMNAFYVSLGAIGLGVALLGLTLFYKPRRLESAPEPVGSSTPVPVKP
jgi:hypothetical protein